MILSIDQGTTGTTVLVIDREGRIRGRGYSEFSQIYPEPGWVSHDANEIWDTTLQVTKLALKDADIRSGDLAGIGITNQRETVVVWDRSTGEPLHDAIVWQCRRTANLCQDFKRNGLEPLVKARTGLVLDPYFSATKIVWLLQEVEGLRGRAEHGDICFGTIDSFLLWKLTGGAVFATDPTNASRTMCYDIHRQIWDKELLEAFDIPEGVLPEVLPSAGTFGVTVMHGDTLGSGIPVAGIAGDQQAALFGQGGVSAGKVKNTYGTGCFALFQTGQKQVASQNGLLTTLACNAEGRVSYALEGSVFSAGSAVQWLRDGLGVIERAQETEDLANSVEDTGGVHLVPAFTGLGAPHWDPNARGAMLGITRGTTRAHVARAALEAIAFQTADLVDAMVRDAKQPVDELRVDGGASANNFLMQFQADILDVLVIRPRHTETTALGAAMLAGLATGFWAGSEALRDLNPADRVYEPGMKQSDRDRLLETWHHAVESTKRHGSD
jgi:glycerol kinase